MTYDSKWALNIAPGGCAPALLNLRLSKCSTTSQIGVVEKV
jgi:hypothetical protein